MPMEGGWQINESGWKGKEKSSEAYSEFGKRLIFLHSPQNSEVYISLEMKNSMNGSHISI